MLDSLDLRNVHQPPKGFLVKDFAVRREHLSQLEGQRMRVSPAHCCINRRLLGGRFPVQPACLKQNWNSTMCNDGVHLSPVELDEVTCLSFDVSAAYKLDIFAQCLSRPSQHVKFFRSAQIIDVTG